MSRNREPGRVQITVTVEVADAAQWSTPDAGADLVRQMVEATLKAITNDLAVGNPTKRMFYYGDDGVEVSWPVRPDEEPT